MFSIQAFCVQNGFFGDSKVPESRCSVPPRAPHRHTQGVCLPEWPSVSSWALGESGPGSGRRGLPACPCTGHLCCLQQVRFVAKSLMLPIITEEILVFVLPFSLTQSKLTSGILLYVRSVLCEIYTYQYAQVEDWGELWGAVDTSLQASLFHRFSPTHAYASDEIKHGTVIL